jgi:hypothetical protein
LKLAPPIINREGTQGERNGTMAEAALCTVWGEPVPGREKQALDVYNEVVQYWARLQQEGKIERFDVTVLTPTGGDVTGFLLVRGTAEQIDSVRRTKEYQLLLSRVQLITTHLRIADAFVDEGLAQIMGQYQEVVEKVG